MITTILDIALVVLLITVFVATILACFSAILFFIDIIRGYLG